MASSATISPLQYTCSKQQFLGSVYPGSYTANVGRLMILTAAIPQSGIDVVYTQSFQLNRDYKTFQIRVYNLASVVTDIDIKLQWSIDNVNWTDVSDNVVKIAVTTGPTTDQTISKLCSLVPGVYCRIKHDPRGSIPALGGTVYINVFQFQN
jgi:hypothetical protein